MNEEAYFTDRLLYGFWTRYKHWDYKRLRVEFSLGSPIALTHPWLHLDGVIMHLSLRRALGEDYYLLPAKFPIGRLLKSSELPNLPIRYAGRIPQASISFFPNQRTVLEVMHKKLEADWIGKVKKLYHGSGYFKEYQMRHIYLVSNKVVFYAVGDVNGLRDLFDELIGLGDNTRVGWGRILGYKIEEIQEDYSIVMNGIATRPIPVKYCKSYSDAFLLSWRPPYWSADNVELCVPPGADVELLPETIVKMKL